MDAIDKEPPVTGPVAARIEEAKPSVADLITWGVWEFLETKTARVARPTMAVATTTI